MHTMTVETLVSGESHAQQAEIAALLQHDEGSLRLPA